MSSDKYDELNIRIRHVREINALKKSEMAKSLGYTTAYATDLESGKAKNISLALAKLISEKYSFNEQWLVDGTGPVFSTSISVNEDDLVSLVSEYLNRIERLLEIITWSKVSDEQKLYHLLRFTDGRYLLFTCLPVLSYNNDNIAIEIRDELLQRDIPILQLHLEDHWFNEYVLYPKREKLEALFFLPDVKQLSQAQATSKPGVPTSSVESPAIAAGSQIVGTIKNNQFDTISFYG